MNDLYLIGNGFDLAHGLETSYNHFLLWYLEKVIGRAELGKFSDELVEVDGSNSHFFFESQGTISKLLRYAEAKGITLGYKNKFFQKIVESYRDYRWVDIEYEYYTALVDFYKRLEKAGASRHGQIDKELDDLNSCFYSIKLKLEEYLTEAERAFVKKQLNSINNILLEGTAESQKLVLYFNYTSTIKAYVTDYRLKNDDLIYVHGKLDDPNNPIIFGYGDEMDPHYEKIENLNNNEFLKNIKSFGYFKTDNYQRIMRFVDSGMFTVKILGHSCGLSDRILLNTIFEHENCEKIKIYYYQKSKIINDYFEKTQEISRHFRASGKGDMRTKIVPFAESDPLVPFDEIT